MAATHVEWVPAEDALADLGRVLVRPLQEVDEGVTVVAVEPVRALLPGHRHLLHVLRGNSKVCGITNLSVKYLFSILQLVPRAQGRGAKKVQKSPDNCTRLNLTSLLFTQN